MSADDLSTNDTDWIVAVSDGALHKGRSLFFSTGNNAPTATMTVYLNRIVVIDRFPKRTIIFPREKIDAIRRRWGAIQIIHHVPDLPPYIGFVAGWGSAAFLADELRKSGYPVATRKQWSKNENIQGAKLYWPAIFGPASAAIVAFWLAFLYDKRALSFLKSPQILSAGHQVNTADFARAMAHYFLMAGIALLVITLIILLIQFWRNRDQSSANIRNRDSK